ncbi:MAG TPA: acetamidase/formamidase family protein [Vicinamibacteria bacterium]
MKISLALVFSGIAAFAAGQSKIHVLDPAPKTVHIGFFDASLAPVLEVDSGDSVRIKTASGNPRYYEALGVPKERIPAELYALYEGVEGSGRSDHTLTGPIAVRGAAPGDTLEVRIRAVDLWLPIAGQGFVPGRGVLPEEFPYAWDKVHHLDLEKKTLEYAPGVVIPLAPFWGVIGVAPPRSMGRVPSGPPNVFGGNMDNRDLRPGASLFLPVHVPGALLSLGDGHAAQGYGEVCLSAVETSLQGEIQLILHKNQRLRWPRAETETHYIAMGLHTDLDEAVKLATKEMLDFVVQRKGLDGETAYLLLSAAMDLVVTQAVDGTKGIHALLPKSIFREPASSR